MTTTPTSPPGFRDGIEAAAKVAEREQDECAELEDRAFTDIDAARWHEQARAASRIARAIRAIPTPATLPTGWNSDIRYYVMSALNGFADLSPEDAIENARHDLNTLLRKLPPPPPGE